MTGTQVQTRPIIMATTVVLTLSAFLWERSTLVLGNRETMMPRLEAKVSSRIAEINDEFRAAPEIAQIEILNGVVRRLIQDTKDIDPAVTDALNKDFWNLF